MLGLDASPSDCINVWVAGVVLAIIVVPLMTQMEIECGLQIIVSNKLEIDQAAHFCKRDALKLLIFFISVDFVFLLLHFLNDMDILLNSRLFSVEEDGGYSEMYQYLKWVLIIVLNIMLSLKTKAIGYLAWATFFLYLLADDSLQIHEKVGEFFAGFFNLSPFLGLRPQDYGELSVCILAGLIFSPLILWSYRSGSAEYKKVTLDLVMLIALLVFFGVFVDMLHVVIELGSKVTWMLGALEDGGEMVSTSIILWYSYLISLHKTRPNVFLYEYFSKWLAK